ncbi:hypothetical protein J2Z69_002431 [Paenibacillus shirakamiensis]|uniref:Oxalate:formate antiporter n=1 Tax=Paenibacillus shirakamiensis TaxID=1265935 RepID=A0ABS4JI59_9BACL|nr:hypothetical protein [Paenibacillus shirakamiensis]MBP2001388.1 hypothetical protein [Paenibacillus shirakamiensis]
MKKKHNIRELIYVNKHEIDDACFYSHGIEFYEFMSCVESRPDNLILLQHQFDNADWHHRSRFDYVTKEEINELIEDNVYRYGDFCWVDVKTEEELDQLDDQQIAELLFFGHLAKPLHKIPMARFAYYAHDDGWFNKLYVASVEEYKVILSKVLVLKLVGLTNRAFEEIPSHISDIFLKYTKEGLFIDLSKTHKSKMEIKIPLAVVGQYRDMDTVIELQKETRDYKHWLVYSDSAWQLI